ncbi:hypothetical protein QTG54_014154 [Skeletonema marinoi]|uniref:MYND-type domain-containing protein n=1 Tax=Skeletonema marinoi TaxID=267567 RepID=A0AAD9D6Z2_9STRA|nr:hypothetical protein QTG54_014154 [Skeletonema marinoi]
MTTNFTPDWRRPRRENDVIDASSSAYPFWWSYSCLVCGKPPPNASTSSKSHKRCARCKSAVYCSAECQKQDFTGGEHKANCRAIAKLWERKASIEDSFWESKTIKSTNPFDDAEMYHEYPTVGKFWHDQPQSTLEKSTVNYAVTLLQLIQLLGRGESWRVSKMQSSNNKQSTTTRRRGKGNPLARELAIDLAFQLLYLDRTDTRVRLLIPSLLLEGDYYQEAYDYLKYWLQAETSMMIMDLALMGDEEVEEEQTILFLGMKGEDMFESPEEWMDGEMIYPSIGMVFELAFLKCALLCSLKSGLCSSIELDGIAEKYTAVGEEELQRQVEVLLSLVHKWNPNLLPNLAEHYTFRDGASSDKNTSVVEEGDFEVATPPGLDVLLNKQPPGFELQYKMGNPGGQTLDEAVAIWQRDMILWHVVDPMAMEYLSNFSSKLQENLVSVESLKGVTQNGSSSSSSPSCNIELQDNEENANKRKEAEELVKRLKEENPDRTMDQIMMHPEMAQLMIKHLHREK